MKIIATRGGCHVRKNIIIKVHDRIYQDLERASQKMTYFFKKGEDDLLTTLKKLKQINNIILYDTYIIFGLHTR